MFNFTAFIRKKWSEYSASSGQKGTVIDELAVKPTGLVLSDFYNSMVAQRRVNDISNYKNMSESDLDFFGNKFFIPRLQGDYAYGFARIYFDQKQKIEITSSVLFVSQTSLQYRPIQPGYINTGSFVRSTDSFALYYVDVPIIAVSKGDSYNVDTGTITQLSNVDFEYKMVTNPEAITNGSRFEDNDIYYNRLIYGINDRSMMNKRSVFSKLPEFFPIIKSIYIASPGDKYMMRDLVYAVDSSKPYKKTEYLGKTFGSNMIASIAFSQIYPLEAGNINSATWGPFSINTEYDYPLTIDPIDVTSTEPAMRGYMLNQEFDDDMYKGIFFDDFKTFAEVRTNDLYNIADEDIGYYEVIVPSSDWVYGAHGKQNGDFGLLAGSVSAIDVVKFTNNNIELSGGMVSNVFSVGKDINKRTGIKLSGSFVWPSPADIQNPDPTQNTNIQFMVGGINGNQVNGFSGIGFGVRMFSEYEEGEIGKPNASLYFAHSERGQTIEVFGNTEDYSDGTYGITYTGALAETRFRIQPGYEYEFEFVVYDDLKLTLYIKKTIPTANPDPLYRENLKYVTLPSTVLGVFAKEINKIDTDHYGTTMKVTLDTESQNKNETWVVSNLKAFDIAEKRATALFALNVRDLEDPIKVYARANGSSAVNSLESSGYVAYIWDKQKPSVSTSTSELSTGAWSEVSELSNSNGSKNALANLFSFDINNIDRYSIKNRFGNNIFIMFATSGTSKMNSKYSNEIIDDIHSVLHVDYIKAESDNLNSYHANNKADLYVSTLSNSSNPVIYSTTIEKTSSESYFELSVDTECKMPIVDIISVTAGETIETSQNLSSSDFSVVEDDTLYVGSTSEKLKIFLINSNSNRIIVEYTSYPDIGNIQNFFNSNDYGKIYGDILVRHKFPINLSFNIQYTGTSTTTQVVDSIKQYFDSNNDGVFIVKDLVSYLYNQKIVNNVKEPINVSYSRYNDDNEIVSGEFTDQIETRPVDFYRISNLTANKL